MGATIHATTQGEGRHVIILHGWGTSRAVMKPISDFFKENYKVTSIDFPGFGSSPPPPSAWGVAEYAKMLKELILQLGAQRPILLGHSFGGRVIIYGVAELGIEASNLILVDAAGIKEAPKKSGGAFATAKKIAKVLPKPFREKVLESAREKYGSADYLAAQGVMREVLVKTVTHDLTPMLKEIAVPSLLIWGSEDTATPLSQGEKMAELLQDASLHVIKGAGHYSFLDNPTEFYAILKENF